MRRKQRREEPRQSTTRHSKANVARATRASRLRVWWVACSPCSRAARARRRARIAQGRARGEASAGDRARGASAALRVVVAQLERGVRVARRAAAAAPTGAAAAVCRAAAPREARQGRYGMRRREHRAEQRRLRGAGGVPRALPRPAEVGGRRPGEARRRWRRQQADRRGFEPRVAATA